MRALGAAMLIAPFVALFALWWRLDGPPSRETLLGVVTALGLAAWVGLGAHLCTGPP
jgi:hypothetical protein